MDDSFATPFSSPLDPLDQTLRNNVYGEEEGGDEEEEGESEVERDKTVVEIEDEVEGDKTVVEEEEDGSLYGIYTGMYFTKTNKIDKNYGVRYTINKNWAIGNSELKFHDDDIEIKGIIYKGTPGLYEFTFRERTSVKENHPKRFGKL